MLSMDHQPFIQLISNAKLNARNILVTDRSHDMNFSYRTTSDRSSRLPSVKVTVISGLYPGPVVYVGPDFYQNMSKSA